MTMHLTPYQPRVQAKSYLPLHPQCELQRIVLALGVAMLACLPMSWANAKHQEAEDPGVHKPALEAPPTNGNSTVVDTSVAPITIEGERLYPDPDNFERKFRDALGPPPILIATERQFTDGAMELTTRFGHFCAKPLPGYLQSNIGGSNTLVARCAHY
jgi:hypothetical protein